MSIVEEIYRIKNLMLSESFKGEKQNVKKFVENTLIKRVGGKEMFENFFDGEETMNEFKKTLYDGILRGDYGEKPNVVSDNLKYLEKVEFILNTLKEEYKKNPSKFEKLNYGGTVPKDEILKNINKRVLYGEFCRDCKNQKDVSDFLNYEIKKIEVINKETERFNNPEQFRKAANRFFGTHDYPGLKPFIYKGFWDNLRTMFGILDKKGYDRNLKKLKDRYGIYSMAWAHDDKNEDIIDFKKLPQFKLKFEKDYDIKISDGGINYKFEKEKEYPFAYIDTKKELFHRTPMTKGTQFDIFIKLQKQLPSREDVIGNVLEGEIMKIIPLGGTVIEVDTKIMVKFMITK